MKRMNIVNVNNSIEVARSQVRKDATPSSIEAASRAFDMTIEEFVECKKAVLVARADEVVSLEDANVIQDALGQEPGHFNRQDLPTKYGVTTALWVIIDWIEDTQRKPGLFSF